MTTFSPTGTGRSGSTQDYTVPSSADYGLTAVGAAGGFAYLQSTSTVNPGGAGTSMYGEFTLAAGDVIRFMVGQAGIDNLRNTRGGGGGGATFVYNVTTSTLLMVAGGGGGAGQHANGTGKHANITANGNAGTVSNFGAGGTAPNGGGGGRYSGGGGGYSGNGSNGGNYGGGGLSYTNGGTGGVEYSDGEHGGYGGGGGSYAGGAGGGGYGGGGAGDWSPSGDGGGGGSFNAGTNQTNTASVGTTAGSAGIVGINARPSAPAVLTPADNVAVNLTSGVDFTYTYSDPDGDAQVGYALRRRAVTLGTGGAGLVYGAEEWWDGSAWVGTETNIASTSQPVSISDWSASSDTYQYALATSDAGGLGSYSGWRTLNPYEWWDGTAWVLMAENYVVSTDSEVTLFASQKSLEGGFTYEWTVSTRDDSSAVGPYASMSTFTVRFAPLPRIWTGTVWLDHEILIRSASAWVKHNLRVWDGTDWIEP
jgi:hypothetical protein